MRTIHLFAGVGGGILADIILGHTPVVAVEWDAYCCQVLRERVNDEWFPGMHVWEGDVRLFDPSEHKGKVGCIHAGFPCQDISTAGDQAGVGEGSRSGLYREVLRVADEIQPEYIFLENVAAIVTGAGGGWLRTIVGDLAERGFDAVWCCLSAAEIGAKHKRNRWWLLAYPSSKRDPPGFREIQSPHGEVPKRNDYAESGNASSANNIPNSNPDHVQRLVEGSQPCGYERPLGLHDREASAPKAGWWEVESEVGRVVDGLAHRTHQLKALGNGQVALQAAVAFSLLWEIMEASNESP